MWQNEHCLYELYDLSNPLRSILSSPHLACIISSQIPSSIVFLVPFGYLQGSWTWTTYLFLVVQNKPLWRLLITSGRHYTLVVVQARDDDDDDDRLITILLLYCIMKEETNR